MRCDERVAHPWRRKQNTQEARVFICFVCRAFNGFKKGSGLECSGRGTAVINKTGVFQVLRAMARGFGLGLDWLDWTGEILTVLSNRIPASGRSDAASRAIFCLWRLAINDSC